MPIQGDDQIRRERAREEEGLVVDAATIAAGPRVVLRELTLVVPRGETHVLFGPNGTGKSTLLAAIMGLPPARVLDGDIRWRGRSLLGLSVDERVALGIGLAFQRPPAVAGLKLDRLAHLIAERTAARAEVASPPEERVKALAARADLEELLGRDVNEGFSGGEMKRSEVFQVALQAPELVLLDEPESGVDVVNIDRVGQMLRELLQRDLNPSLRTATGLIITHSGYILNYVNADAAHVLYQGRIICRGNPRDVFDHVREHGFEGCLNCVTCALEKVSY